jgi:hypothetical protein
MWLPPRSAATEVDTDRWAELLAMIVRLDVLELRGCDVLETVTAGMLSC